MQPSPPRGLASLDGGSLLLSSSDGSQAPRGHVAEKIIFFDRGATPQPVPTPLGRHLLPTASQDVEAGSSTMGRASVHHALCTVCL